MRAARLAGGGTDTVRRTINHIAKAVRGGVEKPAKIELDAHYDPALINADLDIVDLGDRLAASASRRVSLCLSGPPGAGKSAWAIHLANRLGIEIRHIRVSDLLSMWVGGTEQNIAKAFTDASASGAMLIFDEADSLLRDRRGADHSWEVSQVNEMLSWMEVHPLPFICTTNLIDTLDAASLRRFTLKIRFTYLGPAQIHNAFRRFYALDPPPFVMGLTALTPADFALVRRKAHLLGADRDAHAIAALLEAECRAKPDAPRPIGFQIAAA